MTDQEAAALRREVQELRDEVARLRSELAAARQPTIPASVQPNWPGYPGVRFGGCDACRFSGVCNCIHGAGQVRCGAPAACAPLDTTIRIAPGTARMTPAWNAGACVGWPVTVHDATGAAQPFTFGGPIP